jgi:hypothetical protein
MKIPLRTASVTFDLISLFHTKQRTRIVALCSVVKWHLQDPQVLAVFISWDEKYKKTKLGEGLGSGLPLKTQRHLDHDFWQEHGCNVSRGKEINPCPVL